MTSSTRKRIEDIIDLRFLFIVWLKWSWLAIPLVALGAYSGYRDLQTFQPVYVAVMTVLPSSGGSKVSQVGGAGAAVLTTLGLSLGSRDPLTFGRLRVVLGSISLADRLQTKHQLMQTVFRSSWDEEKAVWIAPSGEEFERRERINRFFRRNPWAEPNLERLARYVGTAIDIQQSRGTQFYRISVTSGDPQFALDLLKLVYQEADDLLREQDKIEAERRRQYINTQLERETRTVTLNALRGLLSREEQTRMLLEIDLPYVARIIEPARVSSSATEPSVRRMFGVPIAISLALGFGFVTLIALFRRESPSRNDSQAR
jgi:hypothetical protein